GAPLPRVGLGDPWPWRRAGHAENGRPASQDAGDFLDDADRGWRARRAAATRGLLVEGRNTRRRLCQRPPRALRDRDRYRGPYRVLRDASSLDDLLRRAARSPSLRSRARVAARDDASFDRARRRL